MLNLSGKVALVTGCGSMGPGWGNGKAIAVLLARQGARVQLHDAHGPDASHSAARAAAAMLAPLAESAITELPVVRMGLHGLTRWPELLATLPAPVFFQQSGTLILWHRQDQAEARRFEGLVRRTHQQLPEVPAPQSLDASALAEALAKQGFRLVSGGTDNHMMVVDLTPFDAELTGKEAQLVLDEAGITLNKNNIPNDPRSPFVTSGVRIGTPSVTTQGMKEAEMPLIAEYIATTLRGRNDPSVVKGVRARVAELCAKFPVYPTSA